MPERLMNETADKIINDPSINEAEEFNVFKTWTEYINRLIGAIVGFSLIFIFISSVNIKPFNSRLFILSLLSIILVFFQAWVGSIVVSTNLLPGLITFHVIVALVIIWNVILCYYLSTNNNTKVEKSSKKVIGLNNALILLQYVSNVIKVLIFDPIGYVAAAQICPKSPNVL